MPSQCPLTRWKVRFPKTMVTTILRMRFLAPLTKWWRPIRSCWLMMWCSWSDPVWFYRLLTRTRSELHRLLHKRYNWYHAIWLRIWIFNFFMLVTCCEPLWTNVFENEIFSYWLYVYYASTLNWKEKRWEKTYVYCPVIEIAMGCWISKIRICFYHGIYTCIK